MTDASRVVAAALADLLSAFAHADRIRIIEELAHGERDVGALQAAVGTSRTAVSQHLGLLRARRLVTAVRRGQHVFYQLAAPEIAQWLDSGARLLAIEASATRLVVTALRKLKSEPR